MKFKGTRKEVRAKGNSVETVNGRIVAECYLEQFEESIANAELFAEAINVVNECGFSPRELMEQRDKLLEALKDGIQTLPIPADYRSTWTRLVQSIEAPFTITQPRFQFDVGYIASILNKAEWVARHPTSGIFHAGTYAYEAAKYLSTKTFGLDSIREHIDQGYAEIVEKLDLENRLGWESIGELHQEVARYLAPILAKEKLAGRSVKKFDLEQGATFHLKE